MKKANSHHNSTLRTKLRQLRQAQSQSNTRRGALRIRARLYTWLATQQVQMQEQNRDEELHIAAFWSLPEEPELQPLLNKWALEDNGIQLSLPCISKKETALYFRPWDMDTPMKNGCYDIPEPDTDSLAPKPDIILVPTLGYTRQGDRLGYGKGYYDRTLAALKEAYHPFVSIGIAWACGDLSKESYEPQPHDQPLDAILTDLGWAKPAPQL